MIGPVIEKIKELAEETNLLQRVSFSDPDEFLTYKTNFFPAMHLDVASVSVGENAVIATFNVIVADTNDEAQQGKSPEKEHQLRRSLDTTMMILARLITQLRLLEPEDEFRLVQESQPVLTRVFEQGEQDYYGWTASFDIEIPNVAYDA